MTEQERQAAINYKGSLLIVQYYSVPSRLRINREMHQLLQRHLSGEDLSDAELSAAQANWNTWLYPAAVRTFQRMLIADSTKTSDDPGWPVISQSPQGLPTVWTDGIAVNRVAGLTGFVDGRIQDAIGVATEALAALEDLSQMLANEGDAVAALTQQIASKFPTPTGNVNQYLRGDGTLATFPALAEVALTGLYDDLDGLPTLGSIAEKAATDYVTPAQLNSAIAANPGPQGIQGATGSQGIQGATGATGATGAAGTNAPLIGGSASSSIVAKTTNYTATVNDDVIYMDTTTIALTLTLPVASTYLSSGRGKPLTVFCIGPKTLIIQPTSGLIDNRVKDTVTSIYTAIRYWPTLDGANYYSE